MKKIIVISLTALFLLIATLAYSAEQREYTSPDGAYRAYVVPVRKSGPGTSESKITIKTKDGKILFCKSYGSQDQEQSFVVVKAAWTPDSKFFVYSMSSSGGHQPWHFPIDFDDYIGPITNANFELIPPDTIRSVGAKGGIKVMDREEQPTIQEPDPATEVAKFQLRKLRLEISSLEWQNSWIGRLLSISTVLTILVTLFGAWLGYSKFISDKQKDREALDRERLERVNNQYRADLLQLSQFGTDEKQTVSSVIFSFRDLNNICKVKSELEHTELDKTMDDVALFITALVTSTDYDFSKPRNVAFDRNALEHFPYYLTFLSKQKPDINMQILLRYHEAIWSCKKEDADIFRSLDSDIEPEPTSDIIVSYTFPGGKGRDVRPLDLFYGYKGHMNALYKRLKENPVDTRKTKATLELALHNFYRATGNKRLTNMLLDDENIRKEMWRVWGEEAEEAVAAPRGKKSR